MSAIRELTRVNPSLRKVAALLQSKGRNGDTILAHINPREAQMLLDAGGAGTTNPETGLLEFYEGDPSEVSPDFYNQYNYPSAQTFPVGDTTPQEMSIAAPQQFEEFNPAFFQQYAQPMAAPAVAAETPAATPTAPYGTFETETRGFIPEEAKPGAGLAPGMTPEQRQMLTQLGVAGIQSLPAVLAARRAAGQGRQATAQQQQIAQPYQQMGRQLLTQAQAGQLTPQGQQALQAARAQMAQGIQQRGGVGAQQAATQLEQFRQNLLQQQMQLALNITNIGDRIAIGAIQTGIQADQYVTRMMADFMSKLGQGVSQAIPGNQQTQAPAAPAPRPPGS